MNGVLVNVYTTLVKNVSRNENQVNFLYLLLYLKVGHAILYNNNYLERKLICSTFRVESNHFNLLFSFFLWCLVLSLICLFSFIFFYNSKIFYYHCCCCVKNLTRLKKSLKIFVVMLSSPWQHVYKSILSTAFPLAIFTEKEINYRATCLTVATRQTFTFDNYV